jgi:hypothetical protein
MPSFIEELSLEDCGILSLNKLFEKVQPKLLKLKSQSILNEQLSENNSVETLKIYSSCQFLHDKLNFFTNLKTLVIENFSSLYQIVIPFGVKHVELASVCYQNNTINNFLDNITFPNSLENLDIQDDYVTLKKGKIPCSVKCLTIWSLSKYMSIELEAIPNSVVELYLYYANQHHNIYIDPCYENNYPKDLKRLRENKIELQSSIIPYSVKKLNLEYNHYEYKKLEAGVIPNSVVDLKISHNTLLEKHVIPTSVKKLTLEENILDLIDQEDVIPPSVETLVCVNRYEPCIEHLLPRSIKLIVDKYKTIIPFQEKQERPAEKFSRFKLEYVEMDFGIKIDKDVCFVCDEKNELENCCDKCKDFMCHYSCCKINYCFNRCPMCYEEFTPPAKSIIVKDPIQITMSDIKIGFRCVTSYDIRNNSELKKLKRLKDKICGSSFGGETKLYLSSPFDYSSQLYFLDLEKEDIKNDINRELKKQYMLKIDKDKSCMSHNCDQSYIS